MSKEAIRKVEKTFGKSFISGGPGWFSVGTCKYKLGYKSHDLLKIRVLSLVENLVFKKNPLQDLLSNLNAVISTNERH